MSFWAHHFLHHFNILPRDFLHLDKQSRRFIIASLEIKAEEEKKRRAKHGNG